MFPLFKISGSATKVTSHLIHQFKRGHSRYVTQFLHQIQIHFEVRRKFYTVPGARAHESRQWTSRHRSVIGISISVRSN